MGRLKYLLDTKKILGCTALVNDFTLASRNVKEMNRIEGLRLENWINCCNDKICVFDTDTTDMR